MTSFSSLPWATKLQFFIPTSEHFSSFAMSGLLRSDVLRLRASSRVGSTENKFREHEPRRFVPGRPCVSVAMNFVSLWREDGLPGVARLSVTFVRGRERGARLRVMSNECDDQRSNSRGRSLPI